MTNATKDSNQIPAALGTSNADGSTPLPLKVSPTTLGLQADDNTTGSDLSSPDARRDQNGEAVLMGVSSADGSTPVAVYIDSSTGKLLINSN